MNSEGDNDSRAHSNSINNSSNVHPSNRTRGTAHANANLEMATRSQPSNDDNNDRRRPSRRSSSASSSSSSSASSSSLSSSSSPASSSAGSNSSSELDPSDALQSPLTGLLNFEGFSMPKIRANLTIPNIGMPNIAMPNIGMPNIAMPNIAMPNIDMPDFPNLPSLPNLRSFNMPNLPNLPNLQQRLPDLRTNLTNNLQNNIQNLTTNMRNLSYLSQLRNAYTSSELQTLFNLFRISASLPTIPQLPPLFSAEQFSRQLLKPWPNLRDSVRNMHLRLNDITQRCPTSFHFHQVHSEDGLDFMRIYFLLGDTIYYCDSPLDAAQQAQQQQQQQRIELRPGQQHNQSNHHSHHHHHGSNHHERTRKSSQQSVHSRLPNHLHQTSESYRTHSLRFDNASPSTSSGNNSGERPRQPNIHHRISTERNAVYGFNRMQPLDTQPLQPRSLIGETFPHIECFEYDPKRSRFVYSHGPHLYYVDDHPKMVSSDPKTPVEVETSCLKPKRDVRICPANSDLVAYHCDGDVWCVNIKTGQELRLTDFHARLGEHQRGTQIARPEQSSGDQSLYEGSPIIVGRPCHVIREEFRRQQGFWWRPETDYHIVSDSEGCVEYQILYEETDQSQVSLVAVPVWDGTIEQHRFPRPGEANAKSRLKVAKFKLTSADQKLVDLELVDVISDFTTLFSGYEYLLRAGWLGQEAVFCVLLNRRQTHLAIVLISLTGTFESQVIYEENNDSYWISSHDNLHFLNLSRIGCQPLTEGSEMAFIWSSEDTDYRHLYFTQIKLGTRENPAKLICRRPLTEGQWEVSEKGLWVNEEEKLIYFCGRRDTPLEKHLYTLSYADHIEGKPRAKTKVHRLTELNYTHSTIAFNANLTLFVNIQSNISVPPFGFVNQIVYQASKSKHSRHSRGLPDSKRLALLLVNSLNYPLHETSNHDYLDTIGSKPSIVYDCQADLLPGLAKPELFCCQLQNGELIYGAIFKPEFMESGVRYPTVLEIYGGPEIQLVSNNFVSLRHPSRHLLSSEGYVVVLIDCRGSGHRGLTFEAHSFHRMGQVEIADHVEVLKWLAKNTGYIDLGRVAVKGWSYGGYLALMALAQYPKVFKLAIAGAPVTDWAMYDSGYTERFMGLPSENPDGYFKGNVLNYVHLFPDENNRLLLLHGLMDENVHYAHSISLIKALIEAGKPYDLQVYPTERHIFKNSVASESCMTSVLSYLQMNL